ncbi:MULTISPECIES: NADH:flavin oxidoreductase/NADH oxidase [Pseudomonas]|nr:MULTISPECIES: NADH:flavin oxidoreductase/NADH oxidase [Pseudomonas]MDH0639610.1 NADH:flavin oxidoreductase/NADH oxidase [Pseudomonas sp. GD03860]
MSQLFTPHPLGRLSLKNRLVVAPMCQYSAKDGVVQPWHEQHLGHLACSGAAAVTIEATGVAEEGRVTHGCLGLWNDEQMSALGQLVGRVRDYSDAAIGIQLNHAGRKGSALPPWEGGKPMEPGQGGWETLAPSALPWGTAWPTPSALDADGIRRITEAFAAAAARAARAGLDYIEIHSAHGYLLHAFLSPISNQRDDAYGGSLENRMRFPLAVVEAVRKAVPDLTLGIRINGSDWLDEGWSLEDAAVYAGRLERAGVDYISVSSGGACQGVRYDNKPAYQVHMASSVRRHVSCPVICAGLIADAELAEGIIAERQADFIALARTVLDDPRWPVHAARQLQADLRMPRQYMLAGPGYWPLMK